MSRTPRCIRCGKPIGPRLLQAGFRLRCGVCTRVLEMRAMIHYLQGVSPRAELSAEPIRAARIPHYRARAARLLPLFEETI